MATLATPHVIVPGRLYFKVKRALDCSLCLITLPVVVLLCLIIALVMLVDSGPPVLFMQIRVGRGGRLFKMYKFRTLHKCSGSAGTDYMCAYIRGEVGEGAGQTVYKPAAHRPTRFGRFLRRASLDELPQIINVLKGEMSLVGPRPHVPTEVAAYQAWQRSRLNTLPGITGLAQVNGRSSLPFEKMVRYDIEYVERQSLALDLNILRRTVMAVLRGAGAGAGSILVIGQLVI